jgi:hypothetical protein
MSTNCSSTALEDSVSYLVEEKDAIEVFESDDAVLLHCRSNVDNDSQIFGFSTTVASVQVIKFEPNIDDVMNGMNQSCCCHHPRKDWRRKKFEVPTITPSTKNELTFIDLTKIQQGRRQQDVYPSFDTPGKVFHLLRSILTCSSGLHCASPWYGSSSCSHDKSVALLVKRPATLDGNSNWDELEMKELNELINFRTGDAAPSYYLHSTTKLVADHAETKKASDGELTSIIDMFQSETKSDTMLLVFRQLPPREVLTVDEPKHEGCACDVNERRVYSGCLWERYTEAKKSSESDEPEDVKQEVIKHRMISPPYLSHEQEYPGVLESLLNSINEVREEALKIPQWTAWPEINHYSSSTGDEADSYAAWTVFPLCHTFPANDVSQRKFIETTCSFVPKTTALLKGIGPKLRTALFSRLDRQTTLGAHTGWSDLANYVLRVHIPLVVPPGGSCGTWVDGW